MSEITKDLKYYLANPDEMPTDPKLIEKLANDQMLAVFGENENEVSIDRFATSRPDGKDERTGASSDAEAKLADETKRALEADAAQKTKDEADAAAKATADVEALKVEEAAKAATKPVDGILAKDGKNVIPFAVLTSARERAEAAERLVQQQALLLEQLKAEKAGTTTAQAEQAQVLSDDELAALAEDSPTLAKILQSQQNHIAQLNETVEKLANHTAQQITNTETEARSVVQEAIDGNPILSGWQVDADQTRWNEAARIDKALRDSPLWKDKTFDERFEKVVELTNSVFGDKPAQVQDVKQQVVATPTEAEVRAVAEAKLAAKSKAALPVSLSQIPGGTPPAVDELGRVEQMSSVELGSKFLSMNKEQLDTYLATL